jgi:hypothetical protein
VELVTASPGQSRADVVAELETAHPELGKRRSWYTSVDAVINAGLIIERDGKLYPV